MIVSVAPDSALIVPTIVSLSVITWPAMNPAAAHVPVPSASVVAVAVKVPVRVIGALA